MMNKKGLTLIEVQVALAIAVLTFMAASSLYIFYWRTIETGNAVLDIYSSSRIAMGWMAKDIRMASQIVPNHSSYTTSDSSIVLQVPAINATGSVIASHYDYIIYRLQSSNLYRIIEKDASSSRLNENRIVARYCSSLTFSSDGVTLSHIPNLSTVNTVAIYLPLNKMTISLSGAGAAAASITPTTIVRLRNK